MSKRRMRKMIFAMLFAVIMAAITGCREDNYQRYSLDPVDGQEYYVLDVHLSDSWWTAVLEDSEGNRSFCRTHYSDNRWENVIIIPGDTIVYNGNETFIIVE